MTPEYRIETEKRIKDYFKSFKEIGKIVNVKCEETFKDLGVDVNVWNVKTSKEAYWVVEGETAPMNLYTQNANYLSADEAYSFHMGITQRLSKRHHENFNHVIDEIPLDIERLRSINRKLNMASQKLSVELEPEEFQSIGLICRESLIELSKELCKRNIELIKRTGFKTSDFKNVSNAFIDLYIPGSSNAELRSHSRKLVEIAWSYSSSIVHSPNKTFPDVKIGLLFTSAAVSLLENLFFKHLGFDIEPVCYNCGSKKIDIVEIENNKFVAICKSCKNEEELELTEA